MWDAELDANLPNKQPCTKKKRFKRNYESDSSACDDKPSQVQMPKCN